MDYINFFLFYIFVISIAHPERLGYSYSFSYSFIEFTLLRSALSIDVGVLSDEISSRFSRFLTFLKRPLRSETNISPSLPCATLIAIEFLSFLTHQRDFYRKYDKLQSGNHFFFLFYQIKRSPSRRVAR